MENIADKLINKIKELKSPIVVGIDPMLSEIPEVYKEEYKDNLNDFEAIGNVIYDFSKDIIDVACKYAPCIKLQIAFYEAYGYNGFIAFEKTIQYAKQKDMLVIIDGKRCDIEDVARIYAKAYLGKIPSLRGEKKSYDVDFVTVSPYLGNDTMDYYVEECIKNNKGIFVVVKSSNPSSSDLQNILERDTNKSIYAKVAKYVKIQSDKFIGNYGYSSIGGIVGATFPSEALISREIMDKSILLLPGYGKQGAKAYDVAKCFDKNGLGAIVSSSRDINYAYKKSYSKNTCTKEQVKGEAEIAIKKMKKDILEELENIGIKI